MAARKRKAAPAISKTLPKRRTSKTPETGVEETPPPPFPIAGVGASAGGLEAFTQLLRALPLDTGMGFVVIQHLAPTHASLLAEILSRATAMPVVEVRDELVVKPNHVYVLPPDRDMIISKGALQLRPRTKDVTQNRPIDRFLGSLAADQGHQAIGVILSGTGSDGTLGLEEIKAEGGITFAQDDTAQQDGMPRSAVASGCVDFVLAPAEIAKEMTRVARHSYVGPATSTAQQTAPEDLGQILRLLRNSTGVDFTRYRGTTLQRRITRRMVLKKMGGLKDYARLLQKDAFELEALYQDILISVTRFFRNPELFEALKKEVFPTLFRDRSGHDPIRVWVVGCSTGEEAYSLAMILTEFAERIGSHVPLQIFATDLNAKGIEKARAGIYSKSIEQDVSPERLERFFAEVDGSYRIHKSLRDMSVFARHNLLADPPFSRMDLISCRNLLIYLEPETQQITVRLLHYGLNPKGVLVLGGSETVTGHRQSFEVVDARQRIYRKKPGASQLPIGLARPPMPAPEGGREEHHREVVGGSDLQKEAERLLLGRYVPPGVLIDAGLEIVRVRGDIGPYLAPAPGKASLNLMKMLREGLQGAVRTAIQRARKEQVPVRQEGLRVKSNGGERSVNLQVVPVLRNSQNGGGFLVLFEDPAQTGVRQIATKKEARARSKRDSGEGEITLLNQELAETREYLQSLVEQQEAANEELQSANEEAQSANEELQSVNEELETSKEEIQSSNEELATLNDQLQQRNVELNLLGNDLSNLIDSVRMPIVMVGRDMRIRRVSPIAEKMLNLIPADIGRLLNQIQLNLVLSDLEPLLSEVMKTDHSKEIEVQNRQGRWFSLRVWPYKTPENKVDGAVLVLVDIDAIKRARKYAESIVATVREPLLVLDGDFRVQTASSSFYQMFQVTPEKTENRLLYDLGNGQWRIPELRRFLEQVLPRDKSFDDFEVEQEFEHIGRRIMLLNARRLEQEAGSSPLILLAIEDATDRKQLQRLTDATLADLPYGDLLSEISRLICEALDADICSVLLLAEDGQTLHVSAASGIEREAQAERGIHLGQGISGTVAATRTPMLIEDLKASRISSPSLRRMGVRSVTAVPILSGSELRGALEVGSRKARHFSENKTVLMILAAEKIALAVDRQRLLQAEQQARKAAEAASEAKDDFLAALSHELRTPMTSILGWTQLLEHARYDPDMMPAAIQNIDRGARTQARLIEDMLDVSRMLLGELSIRPEEVDIRAVVEESIAAAEPVAAARNIRIETILDSAKIMADPHRLRQVFGNLLSNAIKFSFPDSRIVVGVERSDAQVSVSVTDVGRGIAPEFLPQMFDRFRQFKKGEYGGLGLGLTIARHIVERHGGTIEANSEGENKGARFQVVLPTRLR